MIKKLRIKFTAAAMISVIVVLTVILGIINMINYKNVIANADNILTILVENDGAFPEIQAKEMEEALRGMEEVLKEGGEKVLEQFQERKPERLWEMSPEMPYESRFFSVILDEEGKIIHTDVGRIAAVDTETAQEYAKEVLTEKDNKGFFSDYRYAKQEREGTTLIVFLDCGRSLSTFRNFLKTSGMIAVLGVLSVFVLVVLLSEVMVRPFAKNYEKQRRFITDAGHEIKTPLTIIDADAAVLEMEVGENEWILDIQKQTLRLRDLTNDLIYLSKTEEDQDAMQMVDFPISELAAETVQSFQGLAKAQEKKLEFDIEPMLTYHGDSKNIQRLFSILLDNALKYSDAHGNIYFLLEQRGKGLFLSVYNTAKAIEKENIPYLFDRFFRADKSRNSQTGGHGIGLSIAKAIVEAHKGKIHASTDDGKSLVITVQL